MNTNNGTSVLGLDREQLLREERFLKTALMKIKNIRNSLQIERLQLENMLNYYDHNDGTQQKQQRGEKPNVQDITLKAPSSSKHSEDKPNTQTEAASQNINSILQEIEESCNDVELNLSVNNNEHLYELGIHNLNSEEEDIEEEDEIDLDYFINLPQM